MNLLDQAQQTINPQTEAPAQAVEQPAGPNGQPLTNIQAGVLEHINNLPAEGKQVIASFLTPEIQTFLRYLVGDEVAEAFTPYIDQESASITVPREVYQQMMGEIQQQMQSEQATQPTATAPDQAMAQDGMAPGTQTQPLA